MKLIFKDFQKIYHLTRLEDEMMTNLSNPVIMLICGGGGGSGGGGRW